MFLKQKTKAGLCYFLETSYGFIRTGREIYVFSYDEYGFISSFGVKLGTHILCFSWMSDTLGYEVNKELTSKYNDI